MSRKIAVGGLFVLAGALLWLWKPWAGGEKRPAAGHASTASVEAGASANRRGDPETGARPHRSPTGGATAAGAIRGVVQRLSDQRGVAGAQLLWLDAGRAPSEERARRRSGSAGHFSVALSEGRYRLRLDAPGYQLLEDAPLLQVMADARAEAWVVPVRQKSLLRGQVVDAEGKALPRAHVGLVGVRRGGRWLKRRPEDAGTITAADGRFALQVPAGVLRLAMRAGKASILSPTLLIPAGREVSGLRLVARADAALTGQVVAAKGVRLRNASVLLDDVSGQREVRCDQDGRFKVDNLSPGELLLLPRAKGMAARSISRLELRKGAIARVVLQMQPLHSQAGRVVGQDGRGVGGARIEVQLLTPGGVARQLVPAPSLRSAPDGRFVLALDTRPRALSVHAPGPLRGYRKGIVPQAAEIVVPLRPPGELAGRISSSGGKPLGFVRLELEQGGERQRLWLITSKGGRFRLSGLMPGTVKVQVEADGLASKRAVVSVRSGVTTRLDLRLGAAGRATGSVRDAAGLPLMGAEVNVEGHPARARTDAEGRFELRGLAAAVYTIAIVHPGYRPQRVEKVRVGAGAVASLPVATLQPLSPRPAGVWRPFSVRELPQKDD